MTKMTDVTDGTDMTDMTDSGSMTEVSKEMEISNHTSATGCTIRSIKRTNIRNCQYSVR